MVLYFNLSSHDLGISQHKCGVCVLCFEILELFQELFVAMTFSDIIRLIIIPGLGCWS